MDQVLVWNGTTITRRASDGYVDATAMCRANGKQWVEFYRLPTTECFLGALSAKLNLPISGKGGLVDSCRGRNGGTWVHPLIAGQLRAWVSRSLDSFVWDEGQVGTVDLYYPRTEIQIVRVLREAFRDQQPCPQFLCCGYRIDLYLAKPRIAVEIDENGHSRYDQQQEARRAAAIKDALGCSFVRANPHAPDFNLGTTIAKVRDLL